MAEGLLKRAAEGAVAGVAGTVVLQGVMLTNEYFWPQAETPQAEDPASFMLWQVEKRLPAAVLKNVPATVETAAGYALSIGYGATLGALYAIAASSKQCAVTHGVAFGVATWAIGYLGWLPAAGLTQPVTRQKPAQIAGPIIQHVAYGIATAAALRWLTSKR